MTSIEELIERRAVLFRQREGLAARVAKLDEKLMALDKEIWRVDSEMFPN